MERAWRAGLLACLIGACTEPQSPLPPVPFGGEGGEVGLALPRKALAVVASAAGADPFALWARPKAQNPDLVQVLENGVGPRLEAITEQVIPCPGGGTLTLVRDDQGPPWPSQGDSYTSRFSACVQGQTTLDGTRRYAILELTGQPYVTAPWRSVSEVTRQDFTVSGPWGSSRQDGVGRVTLESQDNQRVTQISEGEWLTSRDQNGQLVNNTRRYTITQTWDSVAATQRLEFDVTLQDSQFDDVHVRTLTPLAGPLSGAPASGRLELVETIPGVGVRRNTWITAQPGGMALVETDLDGDGVPDTQTQTSWFALGVERYLYGMW